MREKEQQEVQGSKCAQLMLLKQSLQELHAKRDLAGAIRDANLRAAEKSNHPEEAERIQERYLQSFAKLESAMRRTEMQIRAFQEQNPCRMPERKDPREYDPVLLVDDERNIRLTLSQSLEPLGLGIQTAVNGEEALKKLHEEVFSVILLDLKMPGMDGLDVLRVVREKWPRTRVIIITAHGTIESAVEAMKLGAVDFIQKPFSPREIREVVMQVLEREALTEEGALDYQSLIKLSKRFITDQRFEDARNAIRKAISLNPGQPEAYNLTGVLLESKGDPEGARRFYRAALDIDPAYTPAVAGLDRTASHQAARAESGSHGDKVVARNGNRKEAGG